MVLAVRVRSAVTTFNASMERIRIMNTLRLLLIILFACANLESLHAQWVQTSGTSGRVTCFASKGLSLFAGTNAGIFVSSDSGATWIETDSGLTDNRVNALVVNDGDIFAATALAGVSVSTDDGKYWSAVNSGLADTNTNALALSGTTLFAGTESGGIFTSTNSGGIWTLANAGLTNNQIASFAVDGTTVIAGAYPGGDVFFTTNGGASWTTSTVSAFGAGGINSLALTNSGLFAGTGYGQIYLTTDQGKDWTESDNGVGASIINALYCVGSDIFAGTNNGVFLSRDNGSSWAAVDSGLTDTYICSLYASGPYLYAGTFMDGVWRRPITEILTGVKGGNKGVPASFSLSQNYPNPFNPTTTIGYEVPVRAHVTIVAYDILGRRVETLVDGEQQPGHYEVTFNASRLPSGVYFYRLQAGNFSETRKFSFVK